ncbi:methyl-accepting chemotaxis protein [Paraburkholderia sp. GAS333]|uniref:methyl-accepting chemotaxis protein n=1 Tax=Paraburkholderia sp. GAS333 TaxID=3156279 RepID=UPI003D1F0C49
MKVHADILHRDLALITVNRSGDVVMYYTALASTLVALAIGQYYGDLQLAIIIGAVVIAAASLAFCLLRGSFAARAVLTVCNVCLVALHIQLGRGTTEFHFGVFVLLGLLLVYRDWRVLVLAAALFAIHHLVFDRLQALSFNVYCTTQPNILVVILHAGYVVGQTAIEVYLARKLNQAAVEASDLLSLVRAVDQGELICLDVENIHVEAPTARALKRAVLNIGEAIREVSVATSSIENASSEIVLGNNYLSQRTSEQANSLQQTAESMERLTGSVTDTAQTAEQASLVARSASSAALDGGKAVGRVVATMNEISQSSERIGVISSVVDSIAFQTNILALNAAVEAARAKDQGRGFSVVAAEVRMLAQRSATAAKEIKDLIDDSRKRVDVGVDLVHETGGSIEELVHQASRVSELIGTISVASEQQTSGITQVSVAMNQLDNVTQQNAALVEQSAAATESLKDQATRLKEVVGSFVLAQRRTA